MSSDNKVVSLIPAASRPTIPADFSAKLRALADQVDAGEVTSAVIAMTARGEYAFLLPSSHVDSLVLAFYSPRSDYFRALRQGLSRSEAEAMLSAHVLERMP